MHNQQNGLKFLHDRQASSSARGNTNFLLSQCQMKWTNQANWGLPDEQTKLIENSKHWIND